jgi:hypothetical protein
MWYKKFEEQQDTALAEYKSFWFSKFNKAMRWYFPYVSHDSTMILGATRRHNNYVHLYHGHGRSGILDSDGGRTTNTDLIFSDTCDEYYFSASVFYYVLLPQVVAKVFGTEAAAYFHKASGWMRISEGMGGNVSAEHWLERSGELYPREKEVQYYIALIDTIHGFHKKEMLEFLSGNAAALDMDAYKNLCNITSTSLTDFEKELDSAVESAKQHFKEEESPVYYLPQDLLYY